MKTFKGTPGPWHWEGKVLVNKDFIVGGDSHTFSDANKKLIASSPDLLSALQQLVEVYDSEDGKQWTTTSKKAAISEARAAIDKALGE